MESGRRKEKNKILKPYISWTSLNFVFCLFLCYFFNNFFTDFTNGCLADFINSKRFKRRLFIRD